MVYITIRYANTYIFVYRALSNPDADTQFMCLPVTIKNKIYPLAIVMFVNLLAFPRIDILAAALLGYIEFRFFSGAMIKLSEVFIIVSNYKKSTESTP